MLLVEPMFGIPFGLVCAYSALFMKALGLTPWQIGLVGSMGSASAVIWSLLGGHITDRFGRRRTLLISDLVGWTVAIALWAISRNFWYFLAASIVNGVGNIAGTAWTCLLVEDSEPEERMPIFTVLQVIGILSGFFVPLAGFAVRLWGLIPATRGMYLFFLVSLTSMMFIRNTYTTESKVGAERIEATEHHSWRDAVRDYASAAGSLAGNRVAAALLLVIALLAMRDALAYTFSSIYINEQLGVPAAWIAAFPTVGSAVQLGVLLVGMGMAKGLSERSALWVGLSLSGVSLALLMLAPYRGFVALVFSTVAGAGGGALLGPAINAAWNNAVANGDRAKLTSLLLLVTSLVRLPMGWVAGVLYGANPRLPFLSAIALTGLGLAAFLASSRSVRGK